MIHIWAVRIIFRYRSLLVSINTINTDLNIDLNKWTFAASHTNIKLLKNSIAGLYEEE